MAQLKFKNPNLKEAKALSNKNFKYGASPQMMKEAKEIVTGLIALKDGTIEVLEDGKVNFMDLDSLIRIIAPTQAAVDKAELGLQFFIHATAEQIKEFHEWARSTFDIEKSKEMEQNIEDAVFGVVGIVRLIKRPEAETEPEIELEPES